MRRIACGFWLLALSACSADPEASFRDDFDAPEMPGAFDPEDAEPPPVATPPSVLRLAAGAHHTCAALDDGTIACIGDVPSTPSPDATTRRVVHELAGIEQVVAGDSHTCALIHGGAIACWGDNRVGQLGDGTTERHDAPAAVLGLTNVSAIAARGDATCAIVDGDVSCWGALGKPDDRALEPTAIDLHDVVELAVGRQHVCGRTSTGGVVCWGDNTRGQLGAGNIARIDGMHEVEIDDAIAIVAGATHTCAARGTGVVACWGGNGFGQLGDGTTYDAASPVRSGELDRMVELTAGEDHTCARTSEGALQCWGRNQHGQVGTGSLDTQRTPFTAYDSVALITAGRSHTCALAIGRALCWGENSFGQLGDGTTEDRSRPVMVAAF